MSKSKYYQEELEKELQNKQKKQRGKKVLIRSSIAVGAISVIGGIALATSMKTLDEGQIGIVTEFGKITKIEREAGVKFIKPFGINTITKMDIKTKVKSVEMEASSKDEQKVTAKVSYNYHLDSSKAEELYREVGADWERILLEESNIILQCFKNEAVKYNVESILTNREVISEDTKKAINEKLQKYGIVVDSFNAANLDFSKEYNAAVEKKQIAEQEAKTAIQQKEKIKTEAEAKVEQAKGEAKANSILTENLNDQIIELERIKAQLEAIKKWNGVLPNVTGDNAVPFIQINEENKTNVKK